eukprot:10594743-Lingulodinium_polyedra.AAC.1
MSSCTQSLHVEKHALTRSLCAHVLLANNICSRPPVEASTQRFESYPNRNGIAPNRNFNIASCSETLTLPACYAALRPYNVSAPSRSQIAH